MKPSIRRLFASLLIPPTLGAALLYPWGLFLFDPHPNEWYDSVKDHFQWLVFFWMYGVVFCIAPGLLFWGVFEHIWRTRPEWTRYRVGYAGFGAIMGAGAGLLFASFFGNRPVDGRSLLYFGPTGIVVGFVTAWICRGRPEAR
jgi:hypothetical protein